MVPPRVADLVEDGRTVGFSLVQTYWNELWPQPCNYSYAQAYHFYRDGRFRPVATSVGPVSYTHLTLPTSDLV